MNKQFEYTYIKLKTLSPLFTVFVEEECNRLKLPVSKVGNVIAEFMWEVSYWAYIYVENTIINNPIEYSRIYSRYIYLSNNEFVINPDFINSSDLRYKLFVSEWKKLGDLIKSYADKYKIDLSDFD